MVADQLDITNGHAARMRFSRFKQHMEGIPPTPRKPRQTSTAQKNPMFEMALKAPKKKGVASRGESMSGVESLVKPETRLSVKGESFADCDPMNGVEKPVKTEPVIKQECQEGESVPDLVLRKRKSLSVSDNPASALPAAGRLRQQTIQPSVKTEPDVKIEPTSDD